MFEPGPVTPAAPLRIDGRHPRFTMIGGDFETVRGEWGIRGEVGAFVRDNFQASALRAATGSSVDAGAGVDRRAGNYRISGTVLFHHETIDLPIQETRSDSLVGDFSGSPVLARALCDPRVRRGEHFRGLRFCPR